MGVPKLSDDVDTTADALNLVEQYKAWLADLIEETVPHPGHGNMADAALKLAETLAMLREEALRASRAMVYTGDGPLTDARKRFLAAIAASM